MMFRPFFKRAYRLVVAVLPDRWGIQLAYFRAFGHRANLDDPQTFNEKINWRKIHQRDPRFTLFADKVAVKDAVAKLIGNEHIVPTLWVGENPLDIPFDQLQPPYVIKVNHGTGHVIFVREGEAIDREAIYTALRDQLAHTHGKWEREWGYLNIPRKILIERMLTVSDKMVPEDYRFFVYHGRVHFVEVNEGRFEGIRELYCDRDWNRLPMSWGYPAVERSVPKPENFDAMIALAERIGVLFDFVRVDLYQLPTGIFFGETTFYPDAGYAKIEPVEWDLKFGEPWKISYIKKNAGDGLCRALCKKAYRFAVAFLPDHLAVQLAYFRATGRIANLKHPRLFSEKVNWRKLYQHDPRFVTFADKIAVKDKIAQLIGNQYIIPTLWVGEKPEDIPFDTLTPPYVIKTNHGNGNAFFIRRKEDVDRSAIATSLTKQLAYTHGMWEREWGYLGIPHKILVERMLVVSDKVVPEDYKFFVYHGHVHFVQVNYNRFCGHLHLLYCDRHWNKLPMNWGGGGAAWPVPKPDHCDEMIALAEKIGADFDFVRVDLYQVPEGIYFGETTFYPHAGYGRIRPDEWDLKFGEPWKIGN